MPFYLEKCENGIATGDYLLTGVNNGEMKPVSFESGAIAADYARCQNQSLSAVNSPIRYRIKKIDDTANVDSDDWRKREQGRIDSGEYIPVPWYNESWFKESEHYANHFPHMSKDKPGMVAFTESDEKGRDDIQLRLRAGKYLTRYFQSALNHHQIRHWAAELSAETGETGVFFADTPDEIERVYREGPSSCMAHSLNSYDSPCHPTRVYGAGDLAIAYYVIDESITSRVLCWPDKKRFSRTYGDGGSYDSMLEESLESMGYQYSDNFSGARLLRIEHSGAFVCPYLDCDCTVSDNGEYLEIGGGEYDAQQTNGLTSPGHSCDNCGEGYDPDYGGGYLESHDWSLCESCYENITFYCEDCDTLNHNDSSVEIEGRYVCESCASDYPQCQDCCERFNEDSVVYVDSESDYVCDHCYSRNDYFQCDDCGESFSKEYHESRGCDDYCTACAEKWDDENESDDDESEKDNGRDRLKLSPSQMRPLSDDERAELERNGQGRLFPIDYCGR